MPTPSTATYSATAKIAANTAFKDLIDTGSGAGAIRIRSNADALLATIPLADPCGIVNGITGQLAFVIAGPDASADASGTAAYGEICDAAGTAHLALPAQAGGTAVSGKLVLNTLSIVALSPVEIIAAAIG